MFDIIKVTKGGRSDEARGHALDAERTSRRNGVYRSERGHFKATRQTDEAARRSTCRVGYTQEGRRTFCMERVLACLPTIERDSGREEGIG